jgi:hypothetical protein
MQGSVGQGGGHEEVGHVWSNFRLRTEGLVLSRL